MSNARAVRGWQLRSRVLGLERTRVMGIVNITPDSFSDGGEFAATERAVEHGLRLLDEGADLLDLGAESTRPGSRAGYGSEPPVVSAAEEQDRLLPVVDGILRARPETILSVDTYKSETARAALAAGVEIINDVSGLFWDAGVATVCAEAGCGVVLMHTRGRPEEWAVQERVQAEDVLPMVADGLTLSLSRAAACGIAPEHIVLDPGYGFGKRGEENFALLRRQHDLLTLGHPLLVGLSRKSFLGEALRSLHGGRTAPVDQREVASVAALTAAILGGASIVRVHAVRAAVEAARVADQMR